jgi:alpha,alpha-trehalase
MKCSRPWLLALCIIAVTACTLGSPQSSNTSSTVAPTPATATATGATATTAQLDAIRQYIHSGWRTLRRSNHDLLKAAVDPKHPPTNGKWPVYVSGREDIKAVERALLTQLPLADMERLELRQLGRELPTEHGILYLPHPYVVPGGRFNEMYGWDSYFILVGLLRDGEGELAKQMTDNFVYQVMHYGSILNANRTYYLTRSQPPFLSSMVLGVYRDTHDKRWLKSVLPALEKYYQYWMAPPHLTETGLSRYYDTGAGPAPEVLSGEADKDGEGAYDRIKEFYRTHKVDDYDVKLFYDSAQDKLTDLFYVGDRSMRESGYDPSNRFGPFNAAVIYYNPVCLNALLHVMEKEIAEIHSILGDKRQQKIWAERATVRAEIFNRLTWDEDMGLYLDYDFVKKERRNYPFGTTFFPLWAGLATPAQAARLVANLPLLEAPGGLNTSTVVSGNQWDAPYGWAPLQLLAVQGLRRYGYHAEADRISVNFLSLVLRDFIHRHALFEKYDVVHRGSDVSRGLKFGYTSNEIGFGWTNAAFTEMYAALSEGQRKRVLHLDGVPFPPARPTPTPTSIGSPPR